MGIFIEGVMGDLVWVSVSWCEHGTRDYWACCCRADERIEECIDREHCQGGHPHHISPLAPPSAAT